MNVWIPGAFAAALAYFPMANGVGASNGCEVVFPGAVDRSPGQETKLCLVEWIPDGAEQENDFAAHCRKITGHLYIDFTREDTTGRVACRFRPAGALSQSKDRVAELAEIVRIWTDTCLERERQRDEQTTSCWLEAVEAINGYAEGAAFSKQVTELQRAWLQRARDLLTARAKVIEPPLSNPSVRLGSVLDGCPFDPSLDGIHCRKRPPESAEEMVVYPDTPELSDVNVLPRKKPLVQTNTVKLQRKRNFSRTGAVATGEVVATREVVAIRKVQARSVKLAVPASSPVQIKKRKSANVKKDSDILVSKQTASRGAQIITKNRALLIKTSSTSKCFASAEWCY